MIDVNYFYNEDCLETLSKIDDKILDLVLTSPPYNMTKRKEIEYITVGNKNYYNLNFTLLYSHKIDFRIFDDMIPWEKDIYLKLLSSRIKEENEEMKMRQLESKSKRAR